MIEAETSFISIGNKTNFKKNGTNKADSLKRLGDKPHVELEVTGAPNVTGRHAHTNNTQCMHSHTDANTSVTYERSQLLVDSNAKYKPRLEFQKLAGLGKVLCLNHLPSKPPSLWG